MGTYLFIGGPWGGQWETVPDLPVLRVPDPAWYLRADAEYEYASDVSYYRRTAMPPGWLVPLTFYVSNPLLPPPDGTAMPGWIQGARLESEQCGPWRYIDAPHPMLHAACRAWNARRSAR